MTRIDICIEHKNLPLTASNNLVNQMSPEEIIYAIERFDIELPMIANDDALTVTRLSESVIDRETIYMIFSSLGKETLISAIEKTLSGLKLGGRIRD